jgi:ubiquinone/menaquinone biosynthesis C-methylase UbiE
MNYSLEDLYEPPGMPKEAFAAQINRSLNPRGADMLYDCMADLSLNASHRVLDSGCRDARYACQLAERFGCAVVGVDPLAYHVERAREEIDRAGQAERVIALEGRIEALPADDASFDFIWCRDVLSHVADLRAGLAECARVLRPGGAMLVYQTFATGLLEPNEAAWLYPPLSVVPQNMDSAYFEHACSSAGLGIRKRDIVSSEWREHWEEDGTRRTSQQLLRIARMRRDRERMIAALGEKPYAIELADCTWGVYQMLGKLCPIVYTLERMPGPPLSSR